MHSFEVHSNESACRKSDRLGLEQVLGGWRHGVLVRKRLVVSLLVQAKKEGKRGKISILATVESTSITQYGY